MTISEVIHSVWRNNPVGCTTWSQCECGGNSRRGSEPCLECLRDALVATGRVREYTVYDWYRAIKEIRCIEDELACTFNKTDIRIAHR